MYFCYNQFLKPCLGQLTYLFFLFVFVISKLFYETSLQKPILSFILISLLFATYFFF